MEMKRLVSSFTCPLSNSVTWTNRGTRAQRKLSSLTNERDVGGCAHSQARGDYLTLSESIISPLRSTHSALLSRHSWTEAVSLCLSLSVCPPSMEAVALFSFTASEADEISFEKGDIIKVSGSVVIRLVDSLCLSLTVRVCCRWRKWRMILAGTQQRSRGSVALSPRTTYLCSLTRKYIIYWLLLYFVCTEK